MYRLFILLPVLALLGLALGIPALAHTSRAALLAQSAADSDLGLPPDPETAPDAPRQGGS